MLKENLNKILRFRFDDETVTALSKIDRKSEYVRKAVRNQLVKDGLIKVNLPF